MSSQLSNSVDKIINDFLNKKERYDAEAEKGPFSYVEEFAKLRQKSLEYREQPEYRCTEGEKQYNLRKNRYKDIVPYDHSRVKLNKINNMSGTDYINASYISGPVSNKQYIAAQGPLLQTVKDFWRMLWEQNINIILTACREYEGDPPKHRCERYWPNSTDEKLEFDQISVSLEKEIRFDLEEYLVREIRVECCREVHKVYQLHYLNWKDHGVPEDVFPILDMVQRSHHFQTDETVPIVVHCSAGCGRTGTIIAIDYVYRMLKSGKLNPEFDIFTLIDEMRRQRPSMVQSVDQYRFVFNAIAELFANHLHMMTIHPYENVQLKEPPGNPEPLDKASKKASVTAGCAGNEQPRKPDPISPKPKMPADKDKPLMKKEIHDKRLSCMPSIPLCKLKARFEQPTSPENDKETNLFKHVPVTKERCKEKPELPEDDSYSIGSNITKDIKESEVPKDDSGYSYAESKMDDGQMQNNSEYSYADRPPIHKLTFQMYALGKSDDNADYAVVGQEEDCPPLLPPRPADLLCKSSNAEATVQQVRIDNDNNEYAEVNCLLGHESFEGDNPPPLPPKSEDLLEGSYDITAEAALIMADRKKSSLKGHGDTTAKKDKTEFPHRLPKPNGPRN